MATHTLADNARKTTFTASGSETVVFPTKLNWFGVRSLDGADILASKLAAPTQLADGVYSTDEGDGDIIIDDGVFTDTLYLNGTGKVVVFGGVKDSRNPFNIGGKGGVRCLGTTTTELYDGSTANPIVIDGVSVTAKRNDIAFYDSGEFMFNGTTWSKFGDLSGLGDLAYKDTASGSYTPAGSVSVTQSQATYVYDGTTGLTTYTEAGAPSATFTGTTATITVR